MHMVCHQTVSQDLEAALTAVLGKQSDVLVAVGVKQENVLAVIASLGDVMRCAHRHHPRLAGHFREQCDYLTTARRSEMGSVQLRPL